MCSTRVAAFAVAADTIAIAPAALVPLSAACAGGGEAVEIAYSICIYIYICVYIGIYRVYLYRIIGIYVIINSDSGN